MQNEKSQNKIINEGSVSVEEFEKIPREYFQENPPPITQCPYCLHEIFLWHAGRPGYKIPPCFYPMSGILERKFEEITTESGFKYNKMIEQESCKCMGDFNE